MTAMYALHPRTAIPWRGPNKTGWCLLLATMLATACPAKPGLAENAWVEVQVSATQEHLEAVWGSGPNDVFAVGGRGTIVHFDGTTWSSMSSGSTRNLNAVWGTGSSNVYAAGDWHTLLHYDGAAWTSIVIEGFTPLLGTSLTGIWGTGPNDIFVCGGGGELLHYDGTTWTPTVLRVGNVPVSSCAVWGTASDNVYVVGWGVSGAGHIQHFDGTRWTLMDSGVNRSICAIWGSAPNDIYIVSYYGTIWHFNGQAWTPMSSGELMSPWGIWGSGPNDVYVIGQSGGEGGGDPRICIIHWNGAAWSVETTPGTYNGLSAIWGSGPTDIYAVGGRGKVLHYTEVTPPDDNNGGTGGDGNGDTGTNHGMCGQGAGAANLLGFCSLCGMGLGGMKWTRRARRR